jgi:hypothetical protein
MKPAVDPRTYLFAPLLAPTLHIALAPLWGVLNGQSGSLVQATLWQVVAWFALEAVCLATFCPLLWLLRQHILRVRFNRRVAWACAILFAVAASYALLGARPEFRSTVLSWLAALTSATFAFSALNAHTTGSAPVASVRQSGA